MPSHKDLTTFVASLVGLASLFLALASPRRFYTHVLRRLVSRKTRLYIKAAFLAGAILAAAMVSAALSAVAAAIYIIGEGPSSWPYLTLKAPVLAIKIIELSAAVPAAFSLMDAIAVYAALFALDKRGLVEILLVRASSVVPYTLKAPLILRDYGLGAEPIHLYAAAGSQAIIHAVGAALTAYGLMKTLDVRPHAALAAASVLLALHTLAGVLV